MKFSFSSVPIHLTRPVPCAFRLCAIVLCLGWSAVSLLAQEPVASANAVVVNSGTKSAPAEFIAFRQQLDARKLSPERRIAAVDEWRKAGGSLWPARQPREGVPDPASLRAGLLARQKEAALSASGTGDEKELAELQWEMAEATDEMRSYDVSPARRIAMFDDFRAKNREAFERITALRKTISEHRMENAPPAVALQPLPRPPAEAALLERRHAANQLSPEERIAAMDRELPLFKERHRFIPGDQKAHSGNPAQ